MAVKSGNNSIYTAQRYHGGMADTLVLEASAARRGGSSPSGSTKCSCGGMADTLVSEARARKGMRVRLPP